MEKDKTPPPSKDEVKSINVDSEEWFTLNQEKVLRELAETLEVRLMRRLSVLFLVVAVLSFFGMQGLASLLVNDRLNQRLDPQIDKAIAATARADTTSEMVSKKAEELLKTVEAASSSADDALKLAENQGSEIRVLLDKLDLRAEELDSRFSFTEGRAESVRIEFLLWVEQMEMQFEAISDEVPKAAARLTGLQENTRKIMEDFEANRDYRVAVTMRGYTPSPYVDVIEDSLKQMGFTVSRNYPWVGGLGNETDNVHVFFNAKGEQRIEDVLRLLAGIEGLTIEARPGVDRNSRHAHVFYSGDGDVSIDDFLREVTSKRELLLEGLTGSRDSAVNDVGDIQIIFLSADGAKEWEALLNGELVR